MSSSKTHPKLSEALIGARDALAPVWWRFFDWLAMAPWRHVLVIGFIALILGEILRIEQISIVLVLTSIVLKIIAGGKRRADVAAREASERADHESLERRLAEAELAAMQAQIEPHFLFNTLGSIEALIELDPPRAARTQRSLIEYLRAAMPQMRDGGTSGTLGRQLELSRAFLEIMKVRMEERLEYRLVVSEGLSSAEFPPMMLQTLVENSIKHGLEPKAAGGRIEISAEVAHGRLRVSVADTGVGMADPSRATAGDGIGLTNVRERLKLLFGDQASLSFDAPTEGGTRAVIELPYRSLSPATASAKAGQ
ncbi:MAG: histidine kinase [Betaproteobacteria bacterium]|nr:histidine kinase [Betaproteobacteria bacterium]